DPGPARDAARRPPGAESSGEIPPRKGPIVGVRALARVNLAAIERNCGRLSEATPRLCAVVKANAYGHGAVPCARAALAGGAQWLGVATAGEAAELRATG